MPDFKKKYKEYKRKYKDLKRKLATENYSNPYQFQPIMPSPRQPSPRQSFPVLFRQSPPVLFRQSPPVQILSPMPVPIRPVLISSPIRSPSPIFSPLIRIVPTISEKRNYLVVATLNDIFKFKFTETIKLLKKIYFPEYYLKEASFEPHITLANGPRIISSEELQYNDSDRINQILGGFINRYRGTVSTSRFININFSDKPEQIEIYASIESPILSEMNTYLRENVPEIKLLTEENKLNITLLYLKPNIENKSRIIMDAIEDAKNMLKRNGINEGDYISIQSIQLITPFRNNVFTIL